MTGPSSNPPVQGRTLQDDEISLLQLFSVLLKRRWTIFWSTVLVTFVALVLALLTVPSYTASTSFIPQGSNGGASGLAGLAGQFGFQLPTESPGESPQFYAELVQSREILGVLADEEFSFRPHGDQIGAALSGRLSDLLELGDPHEDTWALRRQMAIEWLREEATSVSTGRETGLVEVSITTPWAELSKAMAERMLELLNQFNLQTRQTQASAERAFAEGRLAEVQDSLRAAEDRLEAFLENNRLYQNSPELVFQHGRLQRQVAMQQQVFTSLAEAYEQARMAEVRNTPVITVVERPELPVKPDSRRGLLKLALGIILGGMLGVFLAFGQEYMQWARKDEAEDYQEFSTLWEQTWRDIRTLGGVLGKRAP